MIGDYITMHRVQRYRALGGRQHLGGPDRHVFAQHRFRSDRLLFLLAFSLDRRCYEKAGL
jgi:hypothetical protein